MGTANRDFSAWSTFISQFKSDPGFLVHGHKEDKPGNPQLLKDKRKKSSDHDGMLRALLQVILPLFPLVPSSQNSFTFQAMVPLTGNHSQCVATVFGLLVQKQTLKYNWKCSHTVLEELKICLQKSEYKQVDILHLSCFILKGQSRKAFSCVCVPPFFFYKLSPFSNKVYSTKKQLLAPLVWDQILTEGSWSFGIHPHLSHSTSAFSTIFQMSLFYRLNEIKKNPLFSLCILCFQLWLP